MSVEPFMLATFCDDVRQEVGNKLSFMGIYGANLVVPDFPTTLVKLCCIFTLRVPANKIPKAVVFRLVREQEVLFEAELSPADDAEALVAARSGSTRSRHLTISTVAQVVGLQIPQSSRLNTIAIVDGKELHGGALDLQSATDAH